MFIQFNKEIYNFNHIISISEPYESHNCKNKYLIRLAYGYNDDNFDSETFDTEAEAMTRYNELKKLLTTSK